MLLTLRYIEDAEDALPARKIIVFDYSELPRSLRVESGFNNLVLSGNKALMEVEYKYRDIDALVYIRFLGDKYYLNYSLIYDDVLKLHKI